MNRNERTRDEERGVTRWDPGRDVFARDPFDRLFRLANFFDDGFSTSARGAASAAPCIDIDEDEDSYRVTVELPGVKPEDVRVELNQNVLSISGEKRAGFGDSDEEQQKRRSRWSERSYGKFTRSFTLPRDADGDRLEARFAHGVLSISIPKSEESKPRTIEVQTMSS
jgi:HSP20 family protein